MPQLLPGARATACLLYPAVASGMEDGVSARRCSYRTMEVSTLQLALPLLCSSARGGVRTKRPARKLMPYNFTKLQQLQTGSYRIKETRFGPFAVGVERGEELVESHVEPLRRGPGAG